MQLGGNGPAARQQRHRDLMTHQLTALDATLSFSLGQFPQLPEKKHPTTTDLHHEGSVHSAELHVCPGAVGAVGGNECVHLVIISKILFHGEF